MEIKPILSCPICGKRVRTTQGLQGHVRFKHPEQVPGYERPEFARLNKPRLTGGRMLQRLDDYYGVSPQPIQVSETLVRCPGCRQSMLVVATIDANGELGLQLFGRADEDFVRVWRSTQKKEDVVCGQRQEWINCYDYIAGEDEYGERPQVTDISRVERL